MNKNFSESTLNRIAGGMLVLLVALFGLISCFGAFGGVGQMVQVFLTGVFGLAVYAYLFCGIVISAAILFKWRITASGKFAALLLALFFLGVYALQIFTSGEMLLKSSDYLSYLKLCFQTGNTAGGALFGVLSYPLMKVITTTGALVVSCIAFFALGIIALIPLIKKGEGFSVGSRGRKLFSKERMAAKITPAREPALTDFAATAAGKVKQYSIDVSAKESESDEKRNKGADGYAPLFPNKYAHIEDEKKGVFDARQYMVKPEVQKQASVATPPIAPQPAPRQYDNNLRRLIFSPEFNEDAYSKYMKEREAKDKYAPPTPPAGIEKAIQESEKNRFSINQNPIEDIPNIKTNGAKEKNDYSVPLDFSKKYDYAKNSIPELKDVAEWGKTLPEVPDFEKLKLEQLEKLKEESKKPSISLSKRDDKGIKTFMPEKDNVTAYEPIKKPPQFPVKKIEDRENALNKPVEGSFAIKPEAKKLDKYLDIDKTDKPAVKNEGLDFLLPKTPSEPKFTPPVTSAPKTEDSAGDYIFDGSDGFIDIKSPSAYKTLIEERREKLKERREQLKAKLEEQKARQISIDESIKQEETKEEKKVIQRRPYVAPPLSLLRPPQMNTGPVEDFEERKQAIEETFRYFGVESQVVETIAGPTFTLYKVKILEMPKSRPVSWVTTFANDLEMRMEIEGVKILAPIPGEGTVGIEVANRRRSIVRLSEIIRSQEYNSAKSPTTFAIGKDVHGRNHVAEIKSLPHMLIAGQTGSGKSCCINSLIISLLYHASPEDLRLIMIDPKRTELSPYEGIPHLLLDEIICDIDKAIKALQWCIKEMDRRNEILSSKGYRDIDEYNAGESNSGAEKMYRILIIIDELADLMMLGKKLVEESINRLARLARATGIHLVVATQRPSVDVISGTIKNNLPTRIAFKVPSGADSRTVLDSVGAEDLLGDGDLLYKHVKAPIPIRLQGAFIGGEEVRDVVEFIKSHNESYFDDRIKEEIFSEPESESVSSNSQGKKGGRALSPEFFEVLRMGMDGTLISVSMIQRKLRVGYPKAGAIYDQLDSMKLLGEPDKSNKGRPVIITKEQYDALLAGEKDGETN